MFHLQQELVRERLRQQLSEAQRSRLAGQVTSERRWRRVAKYAGSRADKARQQF